MSTVSGESALASLPAYSFPGRQDEIDPRNVPAPDRETTADFPTDLRWTATTFLEIHDHFIQVSRRCLLSWRDRCSPRASGLEMPIWNPAEGTPPGMPPLMWLRCSSGPVGSCGGPPLCPSYRFAPKRLR